MSDVQKELHQLREKVAEIANDETKNEKTASLKQEQSLYKAEALRLLGDSDDCRKKIRSLVKQTYALGEPNSLNPAIPQQWIPIHCSRRREDARLDAREAARCEEGVQFFNAR